MTDIRKFFPTDKQKQKTKPTKNSKFLDDDEDDFIPVNPTKKNKSKKKKNKNRNKSDLKSLTEPIKPDKNLTFSLPTGLCFSVNAQYQDKTKLSDQPEDIDDEDEKVNFLSIFFATLELNVRFDRESRRKKRKFMLGKKEKKVLMGLKSTLNGKGDMFLDQASLFQNKQHKNRLKSSA